MVLVACCATALVAEPAGAQVPGNTAWGGGEIVDKPPGRGFIGRAGDANVSLRTSTDATAVTVGAAVLLPRRGGSCQVIGFGTVQLASDGSFSVTDRRTLPGTRERTVVTVTGKIEGQRATGRVVGSMRTRGGRRICSGTTTFTSLAIGALPGDAPPPAPAPAGAVLRGLIEGLASAPFDIVLRVAPDGRSFTRFNMVVPWKCRRLEAVDQALYEIGGPIRDDGTFRIVNRYTMPYSDATERGTVRLSGRFVSGGVVGTINVTEVARSRKGRKRVIDRCASGTRAFRAAV
jgi:hypothetical protein